MNTRDGRLLYFMSWIVKVVLLVDIVGGDVETGLDILGGRHYPRMV